MYRVIKNENYLEKVRSFFNESARRYINSDYLKWSLAGIYEFETFLKFLNLPQGSKLLDLGCGTGRYVIPLLKLGYHVTGVDISKNSLQILKDKAEKAGLAKGLELVNSNFKKKIFEDEFDGAYCINTFHLMERTGVERERIFFNMISSLKEQGTILIMTPNPFNPFLYPYYLLNPESSWKIEKNFVRCTPRYLYDLFRRAGLKDIEIERYGAFPTRWINFLPAIGKINESICNRHLIKNFSLSFLIKGVKMLNF